VISGLVILASLVAAIATAASFSRDWRLALLAHFRPHLAAVCAALVLVVAAVDLTAGPKLALLVLLVAATAVHLREILRSTPRGAPVAGGARLRIAAANVQRSNGGKQDVVDWVRRERVDVFVAVEAVRGWRTALAALQDELPHVAGHSSGDVLIFSRHEIAGEPRHLFPNVGYAVAVEIAGVTVVGVHTASPEDLNHSRACDELIDRLGTFVQDCADPVVLVGDFNATPWSAPIVRLITATGLSYGPGARLGSFPAAWVGVKVPAWFGLPIDHVLAGHGASVIERRHGPRIGSDHWPVIAEIAYEACGGFNPDSRSAPVSASSSLNAGVEGPDSSHSA
jgi:endonuclease/exonuclease/phosphatase (EEP) superfamily protein YafD